MLTAQFVLTSGVIVVALVSCFAIGLPLVVIAASFFRMKCEARQAWILSPLAGAGSIILFCQNFIYFDVPVSVSSFAVWLVTIAAWGFVLSFVSLRAMLVPVPFVTLGLGSIVYLIHGIGLLELGASRYFGYGWIDMFNYTSLAEFLGHHPYHSALTSEGFLQVADFLKDDRIGQSILHAFVMISAGVDAQQSFAATALLAPCLMFFALLLLAKRFAPLSPISYLAALAGALAPAIATIHFEGFLSQLLCMPFLTLWPLAVASLVGNPNWRTALISGALLAAIMAIYTELTIIALIILALAAVASRVLNLSGLRRLLRWPAQQLVGSYPGHRILLWSLTAVFVAFAMNFELWGSDALVRSGSGAIFGEIYPWAYKAEGMTRLWLGNQAALPSRWIVVSVAVGSLAIVIYNIVGLTIWGLASLPVLVMSLALLMCLPLGPLIVGNGSTYSYQFYKLLLMVWPLHVFWLVMGTGLFNKKFIFSLRYATALGALVVILNGVLVARLAQASTDPSTVASTRRGGAHLLMAPEFQELRQVLEGIRGRHILVLWSDNATNGGEFWTGWLSYFARDNRVRTLVRMLGTSALADQPQPSSAIVVSWRKIEGVSDKLIFSNPLAYVYDIPSGEEVERVFDDARITVSRELLLSLDRPTDPATWYPIWIAGEPGNASFLTVRFGEFDEFRYDHWGYPTAHLRPEGDCRGGEIRVRIELLLFDKKIRLTCNGVRTEADLAVRTSRFQTDERPAFGQNGVTTSLEGKYPLASRFPGTIMEIK